MIPLRLQIKNFLSYGSDVQEIDFTRYHLICLSGKNGHGKSALLDAITWAVWGQARKTSGQPKPDHGLLRLGQRNMKVVFDFEFNGHIYRVRREFTFAYGKPTAYLEFGMLEKGSEEIIPLTDKTIRKTQSKIELLIGLDYDSFVNSAFIRQGNAGEFSRKSPKERKEILANILGLSQYDELRKLSAEKSRAVDSERKSLIKLHDRLMEEVSQKDILQQSEESLLKQLKVADENQSECEKEIGDCKLKQQKLIVEGQSKKDCEVKLVELNKVYKNGVDQLVKIRKEWQQLIIKSGGSLSEKDLNNKKDILNKKLIDLRLRQKESLRLKDLLISSKDKYQKLEQEIYADYDKHINDLKINIEKLQTVFEHQDKQIQTCSLDLDKQHKEQKKLGEKLQNFTKIQNNFLVEQKNFDRRKDFYQRLVVIGNSAKSEQNEIKRKHLFLNDDCPSCPLCEQNLSAARKRFLAQQFDKQNVFTAHRIERIGKILKQLKQKIYDQHAKLEKTKTELDLLKVLQSKLDHNNKVVAELNYKLKDYRVQQKETGVKVKNLQDKINKLIEDRKNLINNNLSASKILKDIVKYESQLKKHAYSDDDIQNVESELEQTMHLLSSSNKTDLIEQRGRILAQVSHLVSDLKDKKIQISELKKKLASYQNIDQDTKDLNQSLVSIAHKLAVVKKEKEKVLQELGSVQQQIKKLQQVQIELTKLQKNLKKLENEALDYKALVGVFGKNGIQALLIEDAIPEIEQEANTLLGRLTDNQAQLFIESLRDLKSGGTKETLDIKISDGAGLRPYEMFSGGEAFRIDFALRIAISKLLARRAGTALQTLIIDEGFGSQDEEGLSHIMDAIYKIQDDFAKVIIVSHLPSMKEQFPVHFFIQKGAAGSSVSVIEQG